MITVPSYLYDDPFPLQGYYGTRCGLSGAGSSIDLRDPRLDRLPPEWFEGKKCLDVGCNAGHLTLAIVRRFRPCRMVGLDIDDDLVKRAREVIAIGSSMTYACLHSPLSFGIGFA